MDVEDEHSDDDGEHDEDHGEEEVLSNGWDDFCDEQQEDGEGQQDRDAEGDLLPTVRGQVEDQHGQAGDKQAGYDEIDGVEEWQYTQPRTGTCSLAHLISQPCARTPEPACLHHSLPEWLQHPRVMRVPLWHRLFWPISLLK